MDNKNTYEDNKIVDSYANYNYLDKPEVAFLYKYMDVFQNSRMLDIGVGGGRTTHYFSDLVKEYVGIDYSGNMVEACRSKYPEKNFKVCDVRDLGIFKDGYFDIILFSFNGLDYVCHEDRLKALSEIKRILNPKGVFYFSTHNLLSLDELFSIKITRNPVSLYTAYRHLRIKLGNKPLPQLKKLPHAVINDGAHNFKLLTYYITPEEQIAQLFRTGFNHVELYSYNDGCLLDKDLDTIREPWIYYLCTV